MSDETGNGVFVLHSVSGCYAEVHISWEIHVSQDEGHGQLSQASSYLDTEV